jgi:broad specificity phosphatase PhoE
MSTLYLVRHGQASFGADDYDQLSPLGAQQSVQLGRYFAAKNLTFETVLTGTLRRHTQTLAGISEGLGHELHAVCWPGLNEYDSQAIITAIHPEPLDRSPSAENYRHHFGLLRKGLLQWMLGNTQPQGMPSWPQFSDQVMQVLRHVRQSPHQNVLIVSSGGPIACAIGQVLATPPEATVELNMRLRNSAVSELSFTPKHYALQTYNTLSHLDAPEFADWVTHA